MTRKRHTEEQIIAVLKDAQAGTGIQELCRDRGSQYAATSYQQVLATHGVTVSMSRKGNCLDNACIESFFGTLKRELVYHRHYATRADATLNIFE